MVSTLTYGVQWDRAISWFLEQNPSIDLTVGNFCNQTVDAKDLNTGASFANYNRDYMEYGDWYTAGEKTATDELLWTTGAVSTACFFNVYDMAGNMLEWTNERYSTDNRIGRGYAFWMSKMPAHSRVNYENEPSETIGVGARATLYIK